MKIRSIFEDEDILHYIRISIIAFVIFLIVIGMLYFLFRTKTDITFSSYKLPYGTTENTISLIESVGGKQVTDANRSGNMLVIGDLEITATEIDTKKLGVYKVKYSFNDEKREDMIIEVTVYDDQPPELIIIDQELDADLDDLNDDWLKENIKITDNETKDPSVKISTVPENYDYGDKIKVNILVTDDSGNKTSGSYVVHINEKKQDPPQEDNQQIQHNDYSEEQISGTGNNNNQTSNDVTGKQKPQDVFYSADDYDMITASQLCSSTLTSSGYPGSCTGVFDDNNIYQGMKLHFN